jgi:hypothetical protein
VQEGGLAHYWYYCWVSLFLASLELKTRGWQLIDMDGCIICVFAVLLGRLVEILKHRPTPQMSYQVSFCFWLLSFEQDIAEQINKSVIPFILSNYVISLT